MKEKINELLEKIDLGKLDEIQFQNLFQLLSYIQSSQEDIEEE